MVLTQVVIIPNLRFFWIYCWFYKNHRSEWISHRFVLWLAHFYQPQYKPMGNSLTFRIFIKSAEYLTSLKFGLMITWVNTIVQKIPVSIATSVNQRSQFREGSIGSIHILHQLPCHSTRNSRVIGRLKPCSIVAWLSIGVHFVYLNWQDVVGGVAIAGNHTVWLVQTNQQWLSSCCYNQAPGLTFQWLHRCCCSIFFVSIYLFADKHSLNWHCYTSFILSKCMSPYQWVGKVEVVKVPLVYSLSNG